MYIRIKASLKMHENVSLCQTTCIHFLFVMFDITKPLLFLQPRQKTAFIPLKLCLLLIFLPAEGYTDK